MTARIAMKMMRAGLRAGFDPLRASGLSLKTSNRTGFSVNCAPSLGFAVPFVRADGGSTKASRLTGSAADRGLSPTRLLISRSLRICRSRRVQIRPLLNQLLFCVRLKPQVQLDLPIVLFRLSFPPASSWLRRYGGTRRGFRCCHCRRHGACVSSDSSPHEGLAVLLALEASPPRGSAVVRSISPSTRVPSLEASIAREAGASVVGRSCQISVLLLMPSTIAPKPGASISISSGAGPIFDGRPCEISVALPTASTIARVRVRRLTAQRARCVARPRTLYCERTCHH